MSSSGNATTIPIPTGASVVCEVRVPRETVNDDVVTVQHWHAQHGDQVKAKQVVCAIETSKAVLEVEAEGDGYLQVIHPKGAEVPIGELVGRVLSAPPGAQVVLGGKPSAPMSAAASVPAAPVAPVAVAAPVNGEHAARPVAASMPRTGNRLRDRMHESGAGMTTGGAGSGSTQHEVPDSAHAGQMISKKAQRLIDEHGINAAQVFAGLGMVREADVQRHLERVVGRRIAEAHLPPSPAEVAKSTPATIETISPVAAKATVDGAYSRAKSKGLLGDAAQSAKERGNRSVVWLAWNYVYRNWFLGNLVRVAPRGVILRVHKMRGVKMGEDVFIDPTAIVETAFPENITIGNDVRITAGCVIMTHIKAPHYLRETGLVPVVLKPVVLEDHCFIGVNSVIMPGVTVGKASVVTSGSVVVNNVPPYSMVQGNPAKVIKTFPKPEGE